MKCHTVFLSCGAYLYNTVEDDTTGVPNIPTASTVTSLQPTHQTINRTSQHQANPNWFPYQTQPVLVLLLDTSEAFSVSADLHSLFRPRLWHLPVTLLLNSCCYLLATTLLHSV
ncbi:hypothetical protein ILYODFUR_030402 [Ilyodon furcidens]|uniref:Uncharacterized protein n=1 Tax=Ilyodon furcidens TaxID=33524 RepID=A0ABV0T370_9TELE